MPPKKPPSKLTPQGSVLTSPSTTQNCRQPVPAPTLPSSDTIPPLWTPNAVPTEVFPEWIDPVALSIEHWCTVDNPYEDPLAPEKLFMPHEAEEGRDTIIWKRPSEFLPVIIDLSVVPATPPPSIPEPKAGGGKKGAPAVKKGEVEPIKKQPPPPKHAHIFLPKSREKEFGFLRSEKVGATTSSTTSLSSAATASNDNHDQTWQIPRDFQRRWSAEQTDALDAWAKEEERIERELQHRERVFLGFEDAIAYIVNERPRDLLAEVDFDAEDLVDDGEDEDEALTSDLDVSIATSPWGVVPPPRIEIAPNSVYKPEIPHGEIIHADMASYLRIVEQLYSSNNDSSDAAPSQKIPFMWQAIYPQDSSRNPVYNPGGKYSIKLFVFGRWRRVDVDDKLPIDADGNVVYLSSSMKAEIWPSLLVKALYKVMHWLHPTSFESEITPANGSSSMCQMVVQTVLTLTSWKVSRWEPKNCECSSENVFHQLHQYVQSGQDPELAEETNETSVCEATFDNTAKNPPVIAEITEIQATVSSLKPRVILCNTGSDRIADLIFGEAVLVTSVVGDTGNTTFKVVRQGIPTTISEEVAGVNDLVFLLVHSVLKYSDTFIRDWIPNPEPPLVVEDSRATLVPFEVPRVQFVVVTIPESVPGQPPGDLSSDSLHSAQTLVNLVATLTPVQPPKKLEQTVDKLDKTLELISTHLGVDPSGSVVLIEELENNSTRSFMPLIANLNSIFSGYISIPAVDKGKIVYRVYPQKTLRYGYSMQIESDYKVAFLDAPSYWRSLNNLHVIESDGVYPVMLPNTWNILFKQSFELILPTEDEKNNLLSPELRIDVHLSEELLASCTHISIVNDVTNEVKKVSTLCSKITLSAASNSTSNEVLTPTAYTLIVDCNPGNFQVREGKWKLTLASDWDFAKSTTHQMKMTQFEGTYEPNKPMTCFRDVVIAPKTSLWTSFQLQLLHDEIVVNNLTAKLEVFSFGVENRPKIKEIRSKGEVCLLQLPLITTTDTIQPAADDKRGYIIQGSIDKSTCVVPDDLQSLRPFHSNSNRSPPKEIMNLTVDENAPTESPLTVNNELLSPRTVRTSNDIKWRLNCWSTEEVKLQEDNTKELQYEAIRASWAEKAVNRNTNGAVSRLLFLGKIDQAEARMKQENMTEEQIAIVKSRFEWVQAIKVKVKSSLPEGDDESYLEQVESDTEKFLSDDQFAENKRLLFERIGIVGADKEQRQVARVFSKEDRTKELKNLVRSVIENRVLSFKRQQELKREISAVQI